MELPFAGHPTLGTAFVVAARRGLETVKLETGRGIGGHAVIVGQGTFRLPA